MNTIVKTHVAMGQVDQLIEQMDQTGFELDTIREHQMGGLFWMLFRRQAVVVGLDELHLARIGEAEQAVRNAEDAPPDGGDVFVK